MRPKARTGAQLQNCRHDAAQHVWVSQRPHPLPGTPPLQAFRILLLAPCTFAHRKVLPSRLTPAPIATHRPLPWLHTSLAPAQFLAQLRCTFSTFSVTPSLLSPRLDHPCRRRRRTRLRRPQQARRTRRTAAPHAVRRVGRERSGCRTHAQVRHGAAGHGDKGGPPAARGLQLRRHGVPQGAAAGPLQQVAHSLRGTACRRMQAQGSTWRHSLRGPVCNGVSGISCIIKVSRCCRDNAAAGPRGLLRGCYRGFEC